MVNVKSILASFVCICWEVQVNGGFFVPVMKNNVDQTSFFFLSPPFKLIFYFLGMLVQPF